MHRRWKYDGVEGFNASIISNRFRYKLCKLLSQLRDELPKELKCWVEEWENHFHELVNEVIKRSHKFTFSCLKLAVNFNMLNVVLQFSSFNLYFMYYVGRY